MWAVLPVKTLTNAKQRLASALSPGERRELFRVMVEDVLSVLSRVAGLEGIAVVSRDAEVAALAQHHGARLIVEPADRGHTAAVTAGARRLAAEGVNSMVTVPGDVPLVTPSDIEAVVASHGAAPAMTIVPSRDKLGSNCIACSPPDAVGFAFGDGSFERHLAAARRCGIEPRVLSRPRLAVDIDTPADLALLLETPADTRAHRYLAQSGIATRLAVTSLSALEGYAA